MIYWPTMVTTRIPRRRPRAPQLPAAEWFPPLLYPRVLRFGSTGYSLHVPSKSSLGGHKAPPPPSLPSTGPPSPSSCLPATARLGPVPLPPCPRSPCPLSSSTGRPALKTPKVLHPPPNPRARRGALFLMGELKVFFNKSRPRCGLTLSSS